MKTLAANSVLKSRDVTLLTKVYMVKAMVFPVVMYRYESWSTKKAEHQGTVKRLLQHHSSKASILHHSAFFMVQLSHPYMTTGKTIALTVQIFVGKIISLLLNTLSRLVIAFLPRSKCLFNFIAAVTICSDFGDPKIKSATVSTISTSICHEVICHDLSLLNVEF